MNTSSRNLCHRGFTIVEVMFAMTILAIAILGAFGGFTQATAALREGQIRQYRMALIDAKIQRYHLADKVSIVPTAQTLGPTQLASTLPIGGPFWSIDNSPIIAGDLGTGAVFQISPNGVIQPLSGPFASCDPSVETTLPPGAYCREVLLQRKLPIPGSTINSPLQNQINATGGEAYTLWVRISRVGETQNQAIVHAENFSL